jgi:hypothetical protein
MNDLGMTLEYIFDTLMVNPVYEMELTLLDAPYPHGKVF